MACTYPRPNFRQDKLPCRVIDVDGTLSSGEGGFQFCNADNMRDFCVISHRWTEQVVGFVKEIKSVADGDYPNAVATKNWADLKATSEVYLSIMKFLQVLQKQGVQKVWIDMLCIDRSDNCEEMFREISLMGAYYRHCSACYVPVNGFGANYELPKGKIVTEQLPWLNRVWTLQELLLPDNMYFLIELEQWMEEWLARRVATAGEGLTHFCNCCAEGVHFMLEGMKEVSVKMRGVDRCQDMDVIRKAEPNEACCRHCGSPPLLTRALIKEEDNNSTLTLYLVQREALFAVACVAQYDDRIRRDDWEESREEQLKRFDEVWPVLARNDWLQRLMYAKRDGAWFSSFELLDEIRSRQCMLDRDRILGVLGLLGVNAAHADHNRQQQDYDVVEASYAEEQLAYLASRGAFTEQLLVEMCWMDKHSGRSMRGMSWIPDLTGLVSSSTTDVGIGEKFLHSKAMNVSVAAEGPITLTVKVVKGYVICEDANNLYWKAEPSDQVWRTLGKDHSLHFEHESIRYREGRSNGTQFSYFNRFDQEEVKHFNRDNPDLIAKKHRSFGGWPEAPVELTFDENGSFDLPFNENPRKLFSGFQMWLLYLGHLYAYGTVLLCLHSPSAPEDEVHKIGTLRASYLGMRKLLDNLEDPPQKVTIAGLGMYLDSHVDY